eukprot:3363235-Prymnesium_polylepis.1
MARGAMADAAARRRRERGARGRLCEWGEPVGPLPPRRASGREEGSECENRALCHVVRSRWQRVG